MSIGSQIDTFLNRSHLFIAEIDIPELRIMQNRLPTVLFHKTKMKDTPIDIFFVWFSIMFIIFALLYAFFKNKILS